MDGPEDEQGDLGPRKVRDAYFPLMIDIDGQKNGANHHKTNVDKQASKREY